MISFTQGDAPNIIFTLTDGNGNPVDLTGATFQTTILGFQGELIVFANDQHTVNPDQVNFKGQVTLALTTDDTNGCYPGINKDVLTQVTQSGDPTTYRGNQILNIYSSNPLQ